MIVKYDPKWWSCLKEIDTNCFPHPAIDWELVSNYMTRMYFHTWGPDSVPYGYSITKTCPNALMILKLCVHPFHRCKGVGTALLHDIELRAIGKMIAVNVHELNLTGIYWLQQRGYKSIRIDRNLYSGRDGYAFYKEIK